MIYVALESVISSSNISYEFGFSSLLLGIVDDVDSVGVVVMV